MRSRIAAFLALFVSACAASRGDATSETGIASAGPATGESDPADGDASGGDAPDADVDPADYDFRTDDPDDYTDVVDGEGIAFSDTILGRRANEFSENGPVNTGLGTLTAILKNFADLAVAYGRDFEAIGFDTCADLEGVDLERNSEEELSLLTSYGIVRNCLGQLIRPEQPSLALRPMDVFVPNHLKIDFRAVENGELSQWPNGQRPDEQVASLFTALLLDLETGICEDDQAGPAFDGVRDRPCTVDILQDGGESAYWDLPLNPPDNDVELIRDDAGRLAFPYLAPPHSPSSYDVGP